MQLFSHGLLRIISANRKGVEAWSPSLRSEHSSDTRCTKTRAKRSGCSECCKQSRSAARTPAGHTAWSRSSCQRVSARPGTCIPRRTSGSTSSRVHSPSGLATPASPSRPARSHSALRACPTPSTPRQAGQERWSGSHRCSSRDSKEKSASPPPNASCRRRPRATRTWHDWPPSPSETGSRSSAPLARLPATDGAVCTSGAPARGNRRAHGHTQENASAARPVAGGEGRVAPDGKADGPAGSDCQMAVKHPEHEVGTPLGRCSRMSPEPWWLHTSRACAHARAAYVQAMNESPSAPSLVRELHVASDYGQIYIYDPETQQDEWADVYDEESSAIFRAMDDASKSRRFVGYAKGMVDVLTPSQYNWKAPMRVEVSDAPP